MFFIEHLPFTMSIHWAFIIFLWFCWFKFILNSFYDLAKHFPRFKRIKRPIRLKIFQYPIYNFLWYGSSFLYLFKFLHEPGYLIYRNVSEIILLQHSRRITATLKLFVYNLTEIVCTQGIILSINFSFKIVEFIQNKSKSSNRI